MNAIEYLSQVYYLDHQVESKLRQIDCLKSLATGVRSGLSDMPGTGAPNVTSMEDTILRIMEAEEELNSQIDALVDKRLEVANMIARVRNTECRVVLEMRYLCFMKWEDISTELGTSRSTVYEKHRRGVEVVQKILDREMEEE